MIARIWRGTVRTEDADEYVAYVRETGIAHYLSTPGNADRQRGGRDLGRAGSATVRNSAGRALGHPRDTAPRRPRRVGSDPQGVRRAAARGVATSVKALCGGR
jgi:hypothetical protein